MFKGCKSAALWPTGCGRSRCRPADVVGSWAASMCGEGDLLLQPTSFSQEGNHLSTTSMQWHNSPCLHAAVVRHLYAKAHCNMGVCESSLAARSHCERKHLACCTAFLMKVAGSDIPLQHAAVLPDMYKQYDWCRPSSSACSPFIHSSSAMPSNFPGPWPARTSAFCCCNTFTTGSQHTCAHRLLDVIRRFHSPCCCAVLLLAHFAFRLL